VGRKIQCVLKHVISCTRTIALNGLYELEIQSVLDDDIRNYIERKSIILSPSGQFYIVYNMSYSSSSGTVTIKAWHIFYYLSYRMCEEHEKYNYPASYAIASVMYEQEQDPRLVQHIFRTSTDLDSDDNKYDINYYGMNKAYALIGSPQSVTALYGGEIYRDNFYFSIKKRMEGSKENAFLIRDGWNCKGINMVVDDSETVTATWGDDNYGNIFGISRVPDGTFPYGVTRYQKYSYNKESYLQEDAAKYYDSHSVPSVSISVDLVSVRRTSKDSAWMQLEEYNVGDSGTVYCELFNTRPDEIDQRIIEQKYDELAQRTLSVKLCDYQRSTFNTDRYSKLLGKDDSSGRRLDVLESGMNSVITRDDISSLFK
jgi:phage-related protein